MTLYNAENIKYHLNKVEIISTYIHYDLYDVHRAIYQFKVNLVCNPRYAKF